MTYSQKLRYPRWHKKRLQILERDGWACQSCDSTTKNLQVHHLVYAKRDPWDYADECYQTLCEGCHEERQLLTDESANALKMALKDVPTPRIREITKDINDFVFSKLVEFDYEQAHASQNTAAVRTDGASPVSAENSKEMFAAMRAALDDGGKSK